MAHRRPFRTARSGLVRAHPARQPEKDTGGNTIFIPYNGPVRLVRPGGRGPSAQSWNRRQEGNVHDRVSVRDRLEPEMYPYVEKDYVDEERNSWARGTERPAGGLHRGAGISEGDWRHESQQPEDLRHDIERRRNHDGTMHVEGRRGNRGWENPRRRVYVGKEEEVWNEGHDMHNWDDKPADDLRHRLVDSQLNTECLDESGYQVDLRQMIGGPRRQREFLPPCESFDEAGLETTLRITIEEHRDDRYLACHDTSIDDRVEKDRRHASDSIENQRNSLHQNFAYDEYRHEVDRRLRTKELEGGGGSRHHSSTYDDYQRGNQSSERQEDLRYRLARTPRGARYRTEVQSPPPDSVPHTEDARYHHRPVERDLSNRRRNEWDKSRRLDHDSRPHHGSDSRPHHGSDSRPYRSSDSRHHSSDSRRDSYRASSSDSRRDSYRASRATEEEGRSRNPRPYKERDREEHGGHSGPALSRRTEQRRGRPHARGRRRGREVPGTQVLYPRADRTRASETERAPQTLRQNFTLPDREDAKSSSTEDLDEYEMEMGCSPERTARVGNDSPSDSPRKERSSRTSGGSHEDDDERIMSEEAGETCLGSTEGDAIDTTKVADSFDVLKVAEDLSQEPETSNDSSATKMIVLESGTDRDGGEKRESPSAATQEVSSIFPSEKTYLTDAPKTTEIQESATGSLMSLEKDGVNTSHREKAPAHIESNGRDEKVAEGEASHEDMEISGDESDVQVSFVTKSECRAPPEAPGNFIPSETQTGVVSRSDTKKHTGAPAPSMRKTPPTSPAVLPAVIAADVQSNQGTPEAGKPPLRAGQHRSPSDCVIEAVLSSEVEIVRQTHPGTGAKAARDLSHEKELTPDVSLRPSVALERRSLEAFGDTSEREEPSSHEIRVRSPSPDASHGVGKADGSGETASKAATPGVVSSCASPAAARGHVLGESAKNEAPPKCSDSELTDGSDSVRGESRALFASASRENSIAISLAQPQANEQLHNDAQLDAGRSQVQLHTKKQAASVVGPSHAVIRHNSNKESIELSSRQSAALRKGLVSAPDQSDISASGGAALRQVSSVCEQDSRRVGSSPQPTGRQQRRPSESSLRRLGRYRSRSPASGGEDKGNDSGSDDSDVDMQLYSDDESSENNVDLLDATTVKDWAVGAKAAKPALPLQPRVLSNLVCRKGKAQPKPGKSCLASIASSKRATTTDTSVGSLNLVCDSPCLEESATTDLSAKLSGLFVVDRNQEDRLNDSWQSANTNNSALTPTDSAPNASAMEQQKVSSGQNNTRGDEELATSETDTQHIGGGEVTAPLANSRVASQLNIDDHDGGRLDTGEKSLLAGKVPLKITLMRHSSKEKQSKGHQAMFASKPSPEQKNKTLLDVRNKSETCQSFASLSETPGEHASVSGMMQKLILSTGEGAGDNSHRIQPESSNVAEAHDFTGGSSSETPGVRPPGDWGFAGREAGLRDTNILIVGSSSAADVEHQTDSSSSFCSKAVSAEARFPGHSVESSAVALESKCTKNPSNPDLGKMEGGNVKSTVLASSADVQIVKPKSKPMGGLFQELEPSGKPAVYPSFKVQLKKKNRHETEHTQEKTQSASADPQTEMTEVAQDGSSDLCANNLDPVPMDIDDDSATSGGIECINEPSTPPIQPFFMASPGFPPSSQQVPNYAVFQQPPYFYTPPPIPFSHQFLSQPPPPVPTFRTWLPAPEMPQFQMTRSSELPFPPLPEEPLPPLPPEPPAPHSAQESEGVEQPSLESEGLSESSKTSQLQPGESQHAEGWGSGNDSSPTAPMSRPIPTLCDHRVKAFRALGSGQDSRGSNLIDLTPSHQKLARRAADSASDMDKSSVSDQQQKKGDASFLQDGNSFSSHYQGNYFYMSTSQSNPDGSSDGRTYGNYGARDEEANQNVSDVLPTFPGKTAVSPGTYSGMQSQQQEGMLLGQNKFLPGSAAAGPLEMLSSADDPVRLHVQKAGLFGDAAESQDVSQNLASVKTQQRSRMRKSRWSESGNAHVKANLLSAMESLHTSHRFGNVDQAEHLDESEEAYVLASRVGSQVTVLDVDTKEPCLEPKKKDLEQQESSVMQKDEPFADQASDSGKIQLSLMTSKGESNVILRERMLPSEGKEPENVKQLSTSEEKESNTLSTDVSTKSVVKTCPSTEAPGITDMDLTESSSRDTFVLLPSFATEGNNSLMIEDENLEFGENSPSDFAEEVEMGAEGGDESEMQGTFEEEESSQTESSFDAWEDKLAQRPSSESCNDPESHKTIQLTSDTTWDGRGEATSESQSEDTFSRDPSADRRVESRLDSQSSKARSSSLTERQHREKSKAKLRRKSSADKDRDRRPSHSKHRPTSSVSFGVNRSVSWSADNSLQSYFRHGSSSGYSSVLKGFKIPKKKNVEGSMDESSSSQQLGRKQIVHRTHHSGGTSRQVDSASGLAAEAGSRLGTQQAGAGFPSQQSPKDSSSDDEQDNLFSTGKRGSQAGPSKVEDPPSPLQPPSKPPRNRIYDSDSDSELEDVDFLIRPSSSEQNSSVYRGDDWDQIDFGSPHYQPRTFTSSKLDELVAEKRKEALELQEHLERRRFLKEEIENKGKDKETDENPQGELELSEHQLKTLDALRMPESDIQDVHPGEKVFQGSQRLFTSSLSPRDCGFVPGSGELDQYLNPSPDLAKSMIMSDVLTLCSGKFSDFGTILNWVFLIMSVHEDALVVDACQRTLTGHLQQRLQEHRQSGSPFQAWTPPLHIILRAFLNMGAQLEAILPDQSVLSPDQLREATMRTEDIVPDAVRQQHEEEEEDRVPLENLKAVLDCLSLLLQARPSYSEGELSALSLMVAKVAMDEGLRDSYLDYELSGCLENILEKFPKKSLNRTVPALSRKLCQIVEHPHNRVQLCALLRNAGSGCAGQVRQCFAFLALHQMLNLPEPSQETLESIQIRHCMPLLDHLDQLLQQLYSLHSAVLLLECCVNNKAALQPDSGLEQLNSALQPFRGRIRETGGNLDASKVKNAMVRLGSKWSLLTRACSHSKLFKAPGVMPMMENELEDSSPERKSSGTAEETLLETGPDPEVDERQYIVNSDEDMLPDI